MVAHFVFCLSSALIAAQIGRLRLFLLGAIFYLPFLFITEGQDFFPTPIILLLHQSSQIGVKVYYKITIFQFIHIYKIFLLKKIWQRTLNPSIYFDYKIYYILHCHRQICFQTKLFSFYCILFPRDIIIFLYNCKRWRMLENKRGLYFRILAYIKINSNCIVCIYFDSTPHSLSQNKLYVLSSHICLKYHNLHQLKDFFCTIHSRRSLNSYTLQ